MSDPSQRFDPAAETEPGFNAPAGDSRSLWDGLLRDGGELLTALGRYLSVQGDLARAHARRTAIEIAVGALAVMLAVGVLIVASVYILEGLAGGLASLFNSRWAGQLVAGLVVFGGAMGGFAAWRSAAERRRIEELTAKYRPRKVES